MLSTDAIADMLTRMRNALRVKHNDVLVPASKEKKEIARILLEEGYINTGGQGWPWISTKLWNREG